MTMRLRTCQMLAGDVTRKAFIDRKRYLKLFPKRWKIKGIKIAIFSIKISGSTTAKKAVIYYFKNGRDYNGYLIRIFFISAILTHLYPEIGIIVRKMNS